MVDVLLATVLFSVFVAVGLVVFIVVAVLPVFVALQLADARRFSTLRWLVFSGAGVIAGLGCTYLLHKRPGVPVVVAFLPLGLTWAGPGALSLLAADQGRIGGRAGRHE